eukprot:1832528-Rhodomonas_salina.2
MRRTAMRMRRKGKGGPVRPERRQQCCQPPRPSARSRISPPNPADRKQRRFQTCFRVSVTARLGWEKGRGVGMSGEGRWGPRPSGGKSRAGLAAGLGHELSYAPGTTAG